MFNFFRARSKDPITSFEAADAVEEMAQSHYAIILQVLKKNGPLGKDGISAISGLDSNQIARRLSEMEKLDLIALTGRKVKSRAKRNEREWAAL
jgi:predicted HTH transcriptional regulator